MPSTIDFDILFTFAVILIGAVVVLDLFLTVQFFRRMNKKTGKATKVSLDNPQPNPAKPKLNSPALNKVTNVIWSLRYVLIHVIFLSIGVYVLTLGLSPSPRIQSSYPTPDANWNDYTQPITIVFNEPVDISKLKPNLSVDSLQGQWVYERYLGFLPVTRVAKFYPSNTLLPDQRIVIYMTGVARWGVNESNDHALNFYSQKEPEVMSALPENDATEVDVSTAITFKLTAANQPYDKWEFEIDPKVDFQLENPDAYTYILKPSKPLSQSQTYTVNVFRTAITYDTTTLQQISQDNRQQVHQLMFTTRKAPLVRQFSPSGTGVKENVPIQIVFDLPMQQQETQSAIQITPAIVGTYAWSDDHTLVFTPNTPLAKETAYTVTLPAGLHSMSGGATEAASSYTFTTIGAVRVNSFLPNDGSVRASRNTQVRVNFDQDVDHNSAQSKFSISPTANGNITWDGDNLVFTPTTPFAFSTTYKISLSPGIKSIDGLDSRDEFHASFTTVPNQTVVGGFVWHHQDYEFSCAVASAKMVLAWKGINVSEDTIISKTGQDTSPYVCSNGSCTWGNPARSFLGYGNGSGNLSGTNNYPAYGVHWDPINNVFASYGLKTQLFHGGSVQQLVQAITAGHPIQIWWYNGVSSGTTVSWKDNQTGQTVTTINGMHSVVVIGFNGDPDNPSSFITMDPWFGSYATYSASALAYQWSFFNNTGIIVF